jgi:hypothetical protein
MKIDNEISIYEIYRLNRSQIDQDRSDFQHLLTEKVEKLQLNYLVRITFIEEYLNTDDFDIDKIVLDFKNWLLSKKPKENESTTIQKNFIFEIQKNKKN